MITTQIALNMKFQNKLCWAVQPSTVAGACQPSGWAVTLVGVHASAQPGVGWLVKIHYRHLLWDQLVWGGGYRSGGVTPKDYFPLHWARGLGFEPPDLQFFSTQIWILKAVVLLYLLTFQSNLLSVLFLPRNSTVNSFPFFLLPLPSYDKNHITPISHRIFPIQSTPR